MARLLQNQAGAIRYETTNIYGDPTDIDGATAVTVSIVDGSGAAVVTGAATSKVSGSVSTYEYVVTAAQAVLLDKFTATWSFTVAARAQTATTQYTVAGGYAFSVSELRAMSTGLADNVLYPTQLLLDRRESAESAFELVCGVAFVPRGKRVTMDGSGVDYLVVEDHKLRRLVSATVDGAVVNVSDVAVYPHSVLQKISSVWTRGKNNVVLYYEHGHDYPPADVKRAIKLLAKHRTLVSNVDDRALSYTDQTGTRRLSVAGGTITPFFGIPDVDAVAERFREKVPGVA